MRRYHLWLAAFIVAQAAATNFVLAGAAEDPDELVKTAENGDPAAQYALAGLFLRGEGRPQDQSQAVLWYRKAADQNYAPAQHAMGFLASRGLGTPKDAKESVTWYAKAADRHYAPSQLNLAIAYQTGEGIGRDEFNAYFWMKKAAEARVCVARYNLAMMHRNGIGVQLDYPSALGHLKQIRMCSGATAALIAQADKDISVLTDLLNDGSMVVGLPPSNKSQFGARELLIGAGILAVLAVAASSSSGSSGSGGSSAPSPDPYVQPEPCENDAASLFGQNLFGDACY